MSLYKSKKGSVLISVPKSERSESQMEFIRQLRLLEVKILRISANKQKKFNYFINNHIILHVAEAYSNAKAGNAIYAITEDDIKLRRHYIYKSYASIMELISQVDVFYEVYKSDGLTNNQIEDLSIHLELCRKLLKGVLDKDREKARKILKNK